MHPGRLFRSDAWLLAFAVALAWRVVPTWQNYSKWTWDVLNGAPDERLPLAVAAAIWIGFAVWNVRLFRSARARHMAGGTWVPGGRVFAADLLVLSAVLIGIAGVQPEGTALWGWRDVFNHYGIATVHVWAFITFAAGGWRAALRAFAIGGAVLLLANAGALWINGAWASPDLLDGLRTRTWGIWSALLLPVASAFLIAQIETTAHEVEWAQVHDERMAFLKQLKRLAERGLSDVRWAIDHEERHLHDRMEQMRGRTPRRPPSVEALRSEIAELARRRGAQVTSDVQGSAAELAPDVFDALRTAMTLLVNNAVDHAAARRIVVRVAGIPDGTGVRMSVEDDGTGFDPAGVPWGAGLTRLHRIVASARGTVAFLPRPRGTLALVELPR